MLELEKIIDVLISFLQNRQLMEEIIGSGG
jgi:hypothetical protein